MKTPRPYLSWVQMNLWERDPQRYIRQYIYGEESPANKYMELGKRLAERIETGAETKDELLERVVIFLPTEKEKEFEIYADIKGIPLFGKLDSFNPETKVVREIKTGKKWTQSAVDKADQLTFYSVLVFQKYGELPKRIFLDWVETIEDDELRFTGKVETFETKRDMADIISFYQRIKKAWAGIQEATKNNY